MKTKGLRNALAAYRRANSGGVFSPRYGRLMFDADTGEFWCDEFYSLGHNEWREYHSPAVITVPREIADAGRAAVLSFAEEFAGS